MALMLSPQSRGELIQERSRIIMAVEVDHKGERRVVVIAYDETSVQLLADQRGGKRRAGINHHSCRSLKQAAISGNVSPRNRKINQLTCREDTRSRRVFF